MPNPATREEPPRSRLAPRPARSAVPHGGAVRWLTVRGARHNNLQNIDVSIPLGRFTCITGVSGSGKSSLVNDILYEALARDLNGAVSDPGAHDRIDGKQHLDKIIAIDQTPIGRTPRSNPATYIKVFDEIRDLFTRLPDARLRGYRPGRFSFNVPMHRGGGRCEACEGNGSNRIEMDFLADVWVTCPVCEGRRFTRETLQIRFGEHRRPGGFSIADVLELDVQQALDLFENQPRIRSMLQTLHDVGLDYIKLGQPSPTLSGGEAQRIKLARELVKKATGRTLYVLDEPTTGLHFDDIRRLLSVLHGFVDAGNTVAVIEHNLDVVKTADWVIDLGPEGGDSGGRIVTAGTPEQVAACDASHTGVALREVLGNDECRMQNARTPPAGSSGHGPDAGASAGVGADAAATEVRGDSALGISHSAFASREIRVVGARQHNLKDVTVAIPRNQMTVCTGVSGSGKTSFAIDTVYTEGYRRYVESLSAYARQFLGQLAKPRVDHIEGLSPAICIEQKAASRSPRSTVGTITEVYDYMRVLWARLGTPCCTRCGRPIGSQTVDEIVARVFGLDAGSPIILLAPVALGDGESYGGLFTRLKNSGYTRVRIDGEIRPTSQATTLDARRRHRVEVVIDRTIVRPANRGRITEAVEHALALGAGVMTLVVEEVERVVEESHEATEPRRHEAVHREATDETGQRPVPQSHGVGPPWLTSDTGQGPVPHVPAGDELDGGRSTVEGVEETGGPARADTTTVASSVTPSLRHSVTAARELRFSQRLACTSCGVSYEDLSPQHFSFNSQLGWCETCEGLGVQRGAPATSIVRNPRRSLFDGAIAGWPRIDPHTPFGRLLTALCAQLGVRPDAPLEQWATAQRHALMFGTSGEWIEPNGRAAPYRFHWRGFFPAIDAATRNSWELRHRLHNVIADVPCIACHGGRLRADAAAVRLVAGAPSRGARADGAAAAPSRETPADEAPPGAANDRAPTIVDVCQMPLSDVLAFFRNLRLSAQQRKIAGELLKEITSRLQFLVDVGLEYLSLHRPAPTLSGGEAQRIRLASQIGSGLSGVLYVLDEPTIGLHPRDTRRLIDAIGKLRDLGNTLLLVEHDRDVIRSADRILDFGPRAGAFGGRIVAEGRAADFLRPGGEGQSSAGNAVLRPRNADAPAADPESKTQSPEPASEPEHESLTRAYLAGQRCIPIPANRRLVELDPALLRPRDREAAPSRRRRPGGARRGAQAAAPAPDAPVREWLVVRGARHNNLKNIDVPIPLGRLVCITGVSGSGKSSLVNDILWPALAGRLRLANLTPGEHAGIDGMDALDAVVNVDQSPIGATPASNPATYTGVFDWIRELFARLPESKVHGYNANRFSFNRPGGRCEACEGNGQKRIEMHFMPDVWVTCDTCAGRRYNPETLEIRFKGRNIADVLEMRIGEARDLFDSVPRIRRMLQTLVDVGLDYLQLGQPAPTLSGGEAQRVKLAAELGRPGTGRTLYILDEPTTGLHFEDVRKLLEVLHRLVDLGNTVLVVEHNLDVIKSADWIIDLGPEAGDAGGTIVAMGTPEDVVNGGFRTATNDPITTPGALHDLDPRPGAGRAPARPATRNSQLATPPSHTAAALRPLLQRDAREARPRYDAAAHFEKTLAEEKAGLGKIGREVRMPWQVDGRRWHLEQRPTRDGGKRKWEPGALEYVIGLVERSGKFAPTNWSNQASVEIAAEGAATWFLHALTGGEWLLELYFRAPGGTFDARRLDAQLGLKTLDQREDILAYGDWARVDVRPRQDGADAVVVYVHDRKEIDTPAFRSFVKRATAAYLLASP